MARYVGEQFYDISNAPVTREGAYTVADARLSFSLQEGGPEFFIAGNNILDEVYRLYVIDVNSLGFSQAMYGRPRSVAAGVRFDF